MTQVRPCALLFVLALVGMLATSSSAQVTGTGTPGTVGVWTGTTSLGDSKIVQTGSNVVINKGLTVQYNTASPNILGGYHGNKIGHGVVAAVLAGGGAGGGSNAVNANFAVVSGGASNTANGGNSTIGGGVGNTASGIASAIPGGQLNIAQGNASLAAGSGAQALSDGTFVWGDDSSTTAVTDVGANSFVARASGGVVFYSDSALSSGVTLSAGSGSWSSLSDRSIKDNLVPVDSRAILAGVAALPVFKWNYKTQSPSIRHIGPVAQDFRMAFGVGEDEKHISTVDADGVALVAIQALYSLVQEKEQKIEQLEKRLDQLEQAKR